MELGEKLKKARLEAGLSQRELCGDRITRNMLSQIENGSARPSMDTLAFLAAGTGKPISYFLEEDAVASPNLEAVRRGREALSERRPEAAMEALRAYKEPDEIFDAEYFFLLSRASYEAARDAAAEGRIPYARSLLARCRSAAAGGIYGGPVLEADILSAWLSRKETAFARDMEVLEGHFLADGGCLMLLLARSFLSRGAFHAARELLRAAPPSVERAILLGESHLREKSYAPAAENFLLAEKLAEAAGEPLTPIYEKLEICFRELEDYKMAYHYAAKQKIV